MIVGKKKWNTRADVHKAAVNITPFALTDCNMLCCSRNWL
uniref:Uncharacterized protein n=1 Tax=Parascaris univalens TaxID=6257 RepID=A0A914ZRD0_PARUN